MTDTFAERLGVVIVVALMLAGAAYFGAAVAHVLWRLACAGWADAA